MGRLSAVGLLESLKPFVEIVAIGLIIGIAWQVDLFAMIGLDSSLQYGAVRCGQEAERSLIERYWELLRNHHAATATSELA